MSIKNSPKVNTGLKTKNIILYGVAGLAIGTIVAFGVVFLLNMGKATDSKANNNGTHNSARSGDWSTNNTWVSSNRPGTGNNNTINIRVGHEVFYEGNLSLHQGNTINVRGIMVFKNNLSMHTNANINVHAGGVLIVMGNYSAGNNLNVTNGGKVVLLGAVSHGNRNDFENNSDFYTDANLNVSGNPTKGIDEIQDSQLIGLLDKYGYDTSNLLPIELISFTAKSNSSGVELAWSTATETNNDFLTLEKTKDGKTYEFVATIDGAGTSKTKLDYTYVDASPFSGTSYYRLKQTDFDGAFEYFPLVSVDFSGKSTEMVFEISKVWPNPFDDEFTLNFIAVQDENIELVLVNSKGESVISKSYYVQAGSNELEFRDGFKLNKDTYLVYLTRPGARTKPVRIIKR